MHIYTLERTQVIPRPIDETFVFFADAGNLEVITPDWLRFQILTSGPIRMHCGTLLEYRLRWRRVPIRWLTEIRVWEPPRRFVDVQLRGPYRLWEHEHTFEAVSEGTLMRDVVRYALPFGFLGRLVHGWLVRRDLGSIFDYRARKVAALLGLELTRA
jgi:ligand-binding SRPBCC domain-containing protein